MGKLLCTAGAIGLSLAGCGSQSPTPQKTAAADAGWRREFPVAKTALVSSGKAPYFDLTPGTVRTFREGKTTLTITVMPEERLVDGVKTRIVEEREEAGGQLTEISRNYFALDPATGDVYYFGEEVDLYRNGAITRHEGAWLSGTAGAKFGLGIPGTPRRGDRYYQEVAPGIAMDRAEVVGTDETITTPAGVFKHCVHTRETTPIESDVGHKWYAPGIGLIKDGNAVLVSTGRGMP